MIVFFQPAVWLKYAECLENLREIEAAVTAFTHVVDMAPSHVGARMSLAKLHQQLGKHDDALKALSQGSLSTNSYKFGHCQWLR